MFKWQLLLCYFDVPSSCQSVSVDILFNIYWKISSLKSNAVITLTWITLYNNQMPLFLISILRFRRCRICIFLICIIVVSKICAIIIVPQKKSLLSEDSRIAVRYSYNSIRFLKAVGFSRSEPQEFIFLFVTEISLFQTTLSSSIVNFFI